MDPCCTSPCSSQIHDPHRLPSAPSGGADLDMDACVQDSLDAMAMVPGPRLILSGLEDARLGGDFVMFVNAGGLSMQRQDNHGVEADTCFQGGDTIETDEVITEGGDHLSVYKSARFGDFCYKFGGLSPGDYFVDLHFAEIINTNGPKGIRVFDVFVQQEKVLAELDIYATVGANKPLQLVDVRVTVTDNGSIEIKFEAISGTPIICGICIRKAPTLSGLTKHEHLLCNKCGIETVISPTQNRTQSKFVAKYEKRIQELTSQCKMKSDECYEAWMSLTDANQQLERLKMELHTKLFRAETLEQTVEKQTTNFKKLSEKYEHDKKVWSSVIAKLEAKIKAIKQEHAQLSHDAHECAHSIPNLNKMIDGVQGLVAQCEDLKMKYNDEMTRRKELYNQVQETKGNIRVFCRCRPLSKQDISSGYNSVIDFDAAKDGDIGIITSGSLKKSFKFDRVFTPRDNQADVYADASPLVTSVLDGYNVCIFAYGQTGTGKTFTMEGTEQNRGVNYRTLEELFKISEERKETFTYNITVSVLEVYNEQIRDLLGTSPSSKRLEIRQAPEGFHHLPGIVEAKVENIKEVWDVLQAGSKARAVGSNNVNEHSSRSHCMLCIMVKAKNLMSGECTKSKLWLVDLAGSERLAKTDVQGERLKEAQNINRSLSALGDVISALATKSSHIPYRNSKLTHLLQDSLGGDSKALMFVQISPSENDMGETLSSLNFASRVRGVELGPARKQVDNNELQKMKQMLDKVRQESKIKVESLKKLEDNYQSLEKQIRGKEQLCRTLQDKNKELEEQLGSKMEVQGLSERKHQQLMDALKVKEEACLKLQQKVKDIEHRLKEREQSENIVLQHKVMELQCKLQEQLRSESVTIQKVKELEDSLKERLASESILNQKVKELEDSLKERLASESILNQKVKELERKLKQERERSESMLLVHPADASRIGTPVEVKSFSRDEEATSQTDPRVLRSSNSTDKPQQSHGSSVLLKGAEPMHEIKRKRERRSAFGEDDNISASSATLIIERKVPQAEVNKVRKVDPSKAFGRITRTTKVAAHPMQKIFPSGRTAAGVKEKDKTRLWSR